MWATAWDLGRRVGMVPEIYLPYLGKDDRHRAPLRKGLALLAGKGQDAVSLGLDWYYTYTAAPLLVAGVEAVPMIRDAAVPDSVGGNSAYVMGQNEPDLRGMSPLQIACLWEIMEERYPAHRLVSPGVSHVNPDWLPAFRQAYHYRAGRWPRLDALAIHTYMDLEHNKQIVRQVMAYAQTWDVPEVWVTEFGFFWDLSDRSTLETASAALLAFVEWMADQSQIARYAWFTNRLPPGYEGGQWDSLLLCDWATGALTDLGQIYTSLPAAGVLK